MPLSTIITPLFLYMLCCVLCPGQKIAIDVFETGREGGRLQAERVPGGFKVFQEGQWLTVPQEPGRLAFEASGERVDLEGNLEGLEAPMKSDRLLLKCKDGSTFNVTRTGEKLTMKWSAGENVTIVISPLSGTQTPPQPPPR